MAIQKEVSFDGGVDATPVSATTEPLFESVVGLNYSAADAKHGALGAAGVAGTDHYAVLEHDDPALTTHHARCYFKRLAGADAGRIAYLYASTQSIEATLHLTATGALDLRDGTALSGIVSTTTVAVGEWVRLEWALDRAANTQTLDIYAGQNVEGTTPTESLNHTASGTTTTALQAIFGGSSSTSTVAVAIDAFAIGDTSIGPVPAPVVPFSVTLYDGTIKRDLYDQDVFNDLFTEPTYLGLTVDETGYVAQFDGTLTGDQVDQVRIWAYTSPGEEPDYLALEDLEAALDALVVTSGDLDTTTLSQGLRDVAAAAGALYRLKKHSDGVL